MLYIMLSIVLLTALIFVLTWLLVSKYYWGPTGRPIQYRHHADEPEDKAGDSPPNERDE